MKFKKSLCVLMLCALVSQNTIQANSMPQDSKVIASFLISIVGLITMAQTHNPDNSFAVETMKLGLEGLLALSAIKFVNSDSADIKEALKEVASLDIKLASVLIIATIFLNPNISVYLMNKDEEKKMLQGIAYCIVNETAIPGIGSIAAFGLIMHNLILSLPNLIPSLFKQENINRVCDFLNSEAKTEREIGNNESAQKYEIAILQLSAKAKGRSKDQSNEKRATTPATSNLPQTS